MGDGLLLAVAVAVMLSASGAHVRAQAASAAVSASGEVDISSAPRFEWWEGHMMAMTTRRVVALTSGRMVLCYARPGGSGCSFSVDELGTQALRSSPEAGAPAIGDLGRDPRLLPTLPWGPPQLFDESSLVTRVEAERLNPESFVVCFERNASEGVATGSACSLGVIRKVSGGEEELGPLSDPLDTGSDHLIAVQVLEAGTRFSVCHRDANGQESHLGLDLLCKWAEVDAAAVPPSIRWESGAPLRVALGAKAAGEGE
mmetsp:Transcript_21378/g.61608  ORF Transcript_21378/g.61608 Transcript_21378/m.61608 type:complete len:258 (+) Transcript_21378:2-775(+)